MPCSKYSQEIKAARKYRERLLNDPYRPRYHFAVPGDDGRPGDPNGCFYAEGRHHLMYLYRRGGGAFHWGHVSSYDLLHWRHHEDSLSKGPNDGGCFSGGAFVDVDGTAYLSYWIFNEGESAEDINAGIGLAKSHPPYEKWERINKAVIPSTRWGILDIVNPDGSLKHVACADPSNIWKRNGKYYILLGNLCVLNAYGRKADSPAEMRGDWNELFSSDDLLDWTYEGRFYQRRANNIWTDETEDNMCTSYLPLPESRDGGILSDTMLMLFIAHNKGCQYYIGRQPGTRFIPESHGRMSWRDNAFFAPEAYIDGQGRQIMFAWLLDNLENDFESYGWSGVQGLPRSLWLRGDGSLGIAPVKELENLRVHEQVYTGLENELPVKTPDCCELYGVFNGNNILRVGFIIESGNESAAIFYRPSENALVMDLTRSGNTERAIYESAPLALHEGESIQLRLFVDRSVLEVFANERQAISRRAYFSNPNDIRIRFISEGDVEVYSLLSWGMAPTNPY